MTQLALLLVACKSDPEIAAAPALDSGRVTLHRLNRREYDNTVRDLLGTTLTPSVNFPEDDFGDGFSNIADILSISPLLFEMWEGAADDLLDELFGVGTLPAPKTTVEVETLELSVGYDFFGWAWLLATESSISVPVSVDESGTYSLSVRGFGELAGDQFPHLDVVVDGTSIGGVDVEATEAVPGTWTFDVVLDAGDHDLELAYTNEFKSAEEGTDRNLLIDSVSWAGPIGVAVTPPAGASGVLVCDPTEEGESACAEEVLYTFANRAWRRPITPDELDGLMGLYAEARNLGGDWEEGVRTGLKATLISPWFLFRVEIDPDPSSNVPHRINAYELASRMSYFLWSSTPDDRLYALAESGALLQDDVLDAETRRMLVDPKATALGDGLAVEWLFTEAVDAAAPDPTLFPAWDEGIRTAMKTESRLFVNDVLLTDRSMLDLINAPEAWVDARLAAWYDLPAPTTAGFEKVSTLGTDRRGIITQGGLLTALSYPTRTTPVRRGKWVLTYLLCEAPAPPPPNVPSLPVEDAADTGIISLRDQMVQHRSDPACSSCHNLMDPIGFGLEGYSAVGQPRTIDDNGAPVDSNGTLPDGSTFSGGADLADIIAADPKTPACMARQVFTYALGREPRVEDIAALDTIGAKFGQGNFRFADLGSAIIQSDAFRYRTGEEGVAP